ncbi:MAG: tetratricopeptide repeat protein [Oscillatoriales cyanobacterium SM2_1_8]|nr:tetratricopeptide repeat protein [Oscillatoriales cyanobacterium SM2_1_8]
MDRVADRAANRAWTSGLQALQQQDWPAALTALHRTIALPDHPKYWAKRQGALNNRCLVYIQLQQYQRAIADCSAALHASPTEATYLNRGIAHHRLGRFDRATADFTAALRLSPRSAEAWLDRALVQIDLGQLQRARHDLLRAAACCDRHTPLHRYIQQTLAALPRASTAA